MTVKKKLPHLWILLPLPHYMLKLQCFKSYCYFLFPGNYIVNKSCPSSVSYPRTVIFRTVGYVLFHSICSNLALLVLHSQKYCSSSAVYYFLGYGNSLTRIHVMFTMFLCSKIQRCDFQQPFDINPPHPCVPSDFPETPDSISSLHAPCRAWLYSWQYTKY